MKIMKLNGCIENYKGLTYEWVCGEVEFNLIYDEDGDLYGIGIEGMTEKTLDKIVDEPWCFDFPYTLEEYNNKLN